MSGNLFTLPKATPLDNGAVVPGGKLTFTQSGTTTPQNTYQDVDLATPHTNPVVADAEGVFAPIYFDPSFGNYRVKLTDSDDVLIWQVDGIPASQSGQSLELEAAAPYIQWRESDAAANNKVWRLYVNSEQFKVQLGNDDEDTFADIVTIDRTANTADSVALVADALTLGGDDLVTETAGTFSSAVTGGSGGANSTFQYEVRNNICTIYSPDGNVVTSTTTALTLPNLPAAIRPDTVVRVPSLVADGNVSPTGGMELGLAQIAAAGDTITFLMGSPLSATGFNSGGGGEVKGLPAGWFITYPLT